MKVRFFNPRVEKFASSFDENINRKIVEAFEFLEIHGYLLGMPFSKPIGGKIFELRVVDQIQVRFLYVFLSGSVWILHGFVKKTKRISRRDIDYANKEFSRLLHSV